jgi:predicted metal-dependent phosphoesterase TrpH
MWFTADLHLHSDRSSDCSIPPERVVEAALRRGVRVCALTDHHDVSGFPEARAAARSRPVTVLPGVEVTCPTGRSGVHVIGVFSPRIDLDRVTADLELEAAGIGSASGAVPYEVPEAVTRIQALDGLAIAAHARASKGLFEEARSHTLARVADTCTFNAIELAEARDPHREVTLPEGFREIPVICGSDAHILEDFVSEGHPFGVGSRPFWAQGPSANFRGVAWALRPPHEGYIDCTGALPAARRGRISSLLGLGDHWLKAVMDDRPRHREQIISAVLERLNADGGFVLVGARRRFAGATRGADLQLSPQALHDFLVNAIQPSPVIRIRRYREEHGFIHELAVLRTENPARIYERRGRSDAATAARANRAALQRLGALDIKAFAEHLDGKARSGVLPIGELVRLWPYRDWFSADTRIIDAVSQSLVQHVINSERPPRWMRSWARELSRTRLHYRKAYQDLARRAETASHRDKLRDALGESVRAGHLKPQQRKNVLAWFERAQARINEGLSPFPPPDAELEHVRKRAEQVYGAELLSDLDTEAERARAQYRAAMHEAFGAQDAIVLEAQFGGSDDVRIADLEKLGIDKVIVGGAGARSDSVIVVRDSLSAMNAPQLLALWAQPDEPESDVVPAIVKRCVEAGKHLPIFRFARYLDRGEVEQLIEDLAEVGATQQRNLIIRDVRRLLEPPLPAWTDDGSHRAAVEALDDRPTVAELSAASARAVDDPATVREILRDRPTVRAAILRAAEPRNTQNLRRPAIVLAGALGEEQLIEWWHLETGHQVRLSLVQGIGLLHTTT